MKDPRPRSLWAWLLGGGLALGLAACAPAAGPAPAAPAQPGAAPSQPAPVAATAPRDGGIFHHTPFGAATSLDYCKHADAFGGMFWTPVFEGLLSFDYKAGEDYRKENKVVPFLAERWEQPDDTTYIFHLRKGVKFHDGQPMTADDVVFSFQYIRDPANTCFQRAQLAATKSIEKVDGSTVKITTDGPQAAFLENLAQREVVVFPKHIHDAGKLFSSVESQVGTGPLRTKSWDRDTRAVYTPNRDYWRSKPHLDGAVAIHSTDRSARFAAFVAKQTDVLTVSDKKEFDTAMAQVPDAYGEGFPTSHGYSIYMRVDRAPLNDLRVRRAIHLALDRQQMEATLAHGLGRINPPAVAAIMDFAVPQQELLKLPGYRQPKDQDATEAKRLLAEAGYPDGFTASIQAVAQWTNPRIAEVAAAQLPKVGITLKLDFIDQGVYFANQRKGDFEMQLNGMSADFIDRSLHQYFYSRAGGNAARIADSQLDDLIELQRKTLDGEKRKKVLRQIQEYLLEKMYVVPTVDLGFHWAVHPWVHDIVNSRSTSVYLYRAADLWLDERAPQRTLP
ncbi:MAG: ABC transporter substrate-binding protein [Chloroflexi bacterium]|nr:ABC transporter substrate-binding protein [Chloroflexota bacterium]